MRFFSNRTTRSHLRLHFHRSTLSIYLEQISHSQSECTYEFNTQNTRIILYFRKNVELSLSFFSIARWYTVQHILLSICVRVTPEFRFDWVCIRLWIADWIELCRSFRELVLVNALPVARAELVRVRVDWPRVRVLDARSAADVHFQLVPVLELIEGRGKQMLVSTDVFDVRTDHNALLFLIKILIMK